MDDLQGKRILVIDDEPEQLEFVKDVFARQDVRVYTATTGREGLQLFHAHHPDLVIVDLMMPKLDGWEVCRHIRQVSSAPILMLTALGRDEEIVRGLNLGADDYVTKPVSPKVLLARARAMVRRATMEPADKTLVTYDDGYLTVDLEKRRVLADGEPVELSVIEYQLLALLVQHADHVLTYPRILRQVWRVGHRDRPEYVHAYIWRLRQKLEPDPKNPVYLLSERGVGYRFAK